MPKCCIQDSATRSKDSSDIETLTYQPVKGMVSVDEQMNRIMNDANRRVKELKRMKTANPDEMEQKANKDVSANGDGNTFEELEVPVDMDNFGGLMEWSPKAAPAKKKRKGFMKLSSYEGQQFSQISAGGGSASHSPMSVSKSPISITKSHRSLMDSGTKSKLNVSPITPIKMQKSVSSQIHRSAGSFIGKKSKSNTMSNLSNIGE